MDAFDLRKGYLIYPNEKDKLLFFEKLVANGIIDLGTKQIACCDCGNKIVIDDDFNKNKYKSCDVCGRGVKLTDNIETLNFVQKINYSVIIELLDSQLSSIFHENICYDQDKRYWRASNNGKTILFILIDVSNYTDFLSIASEEAIYFYIDAVKIVNIINNLNKSRFIRIFDPILDNKEKFIKLIDNIPYEKTLRYIALEDKFTEYIQKCTADDFEKVFVPNFIESLKIESAKLEALYYRLTLRDHTLVNGKCVKVGGPGEEDFDLINIRQYLQDGLQPERLGEVKKYYKTTFTAGEFGLALFHGTPHNPRPYTFIISTNDIHPGVWAKIIDEKIGGHYYHVIIDRAMIIFLIYNLGLEKLIS